MEALNFARDTAEDLIAKRAFVYTIDNTASSARSFAAMPMIVDEDQLVQMQTRGISDGNLLERTTVNKWTTINEELNEEFMEIENFKNSFIDFKNKIVEN